MGAVEWVLLLCLATVWGGSFFFGKLALAELPPLSLAATRVGLAAAALAMLLRSRGESLPANPRAWLPYLGMAVLNNAIPFTLIFWGQTQITAGLASILNATTPIFTVLVAHALTVDERLTPTRVAGAVLGLAGVAGMVGPDALAGLGGQVLAQAAVLAAALSYAFAGVFGRRFRGQSPYRTATGQLAASSAMMVPIALLVDAPWQRSLPGVTTVGAVLGLALISTALAYVLYFRILAAAGATNLLLVTLLIPVSAILLSVAFLGEGVTPAQLAGMGTIGLSLLVIDGRIPSAATTIAARIDRSRRDLWGS
ncbi:MAG: DMT family transporter [Chloroflexota bacterium]